MKQGIHPDYIETKVTCGCGASWLTRSTKAEINVEICSSCHPFYTGRAKFVDTAGRIERFQRKYAWTEEAAQAATQKKGQGGGGKAEAAEAGGE